MELPKRNAVVMVSDERIFPAAVFNAVRLTQLNPRSDTDIILFTDWEHGIAEARPVYPGIQFRLGEFSEIAAKGLPVPERLPVATYKRLILPHELAAEYNRLLYLDVDTFVMSAEVFQLFDLHLEGKVAAAARSIRLNFGKDVQELRNRRGWRWGVHFNAGVLLIDAQKWIEHEVARLTFEEAERNRGSSYYNDEPALNSVLDGEWFEISPRFNMNFAFSETELTRALPPIVYHFMGPLKFWHTPSPSAKHQARLELERFLIGSPWEGFIKQWANPRKIWKQRLKQVLRHTGFAARDRFRLPTLAEANIDTKALREFVTDANFADVVQ